MFLIKPLKLLLFSSECKTCPASNLLKGNGFSKWKCDKPGAKQAVVEFLLPEPTQITQIDIGNEASAFVEILVKRQAEGGDYHVLLPTSSFLSPVESKEHKNINRVRMFGTDKFISNVADNKWDTIRVVCSQPFINDLQYGLSFIRFYSNKDISKSDTPVVAAESSTSSEESKAVKRLSVIPNEDEDDADLKVGSLFAKKKQRLSGDEDENKSQTSQDSASNKNVISKIRQASDTGKIPHRTEPEQKPKKPSVVSKPSKVTAPAKESLPQSSNSSSSKKTSVSSERASKPASSNASTSSPQVPFNKLMDGVVFALSGYKNPLRGQLRDKALQLGAKYKPDWDDNCSHLICAFPGTPKFEEVKSKGFIVSEKWIIDSHTARRLQPWRRYRVGRAPSPPSRLLQKFDPNGRTDKRAGRVELSKRTYAESSDENDETGSDDTPANRKGRRSVRRKRTSSSGEDEAPSEAGSEDDWRPTKRQVSSSSSSDEEEGSDLEANEDEESPSPQKKMTLQKKNIEPTKVEHNHPPDLKEDEEDKMEIEPIKPKTTQNVSPSHTVSRDDNIPKKTPPPSKKSPKKSPKKTTAQVASDSDEEGWAVIRRKSQNPNSSTSSPSKNPSVSPGGMDEKSPTVNKSSSATVANTNGSISVPELPNFLDGKHFFLFGEFSENERRILKRFIVAFGGHLENYMSDEVSLVITNASWSKEFDNALSNNAKLVFVKPEWLFECDKKTNFVPYEKFRVVKT